jgi:putative sugar O-methyltransferase
MTLPDALKLTNDHFIEMAAEVDAGSDLYRPSTFWKDLNSINKQWLEEFGLENFKRTVSQNYFNWLIRSPRDPQFLAVLRQWLHRPTAAPLFSRLERPDLLKTAVGTEGSLGRSARQIYRLFVSMHWEMTAKEDRMGLTDVLEEPALGNPIRVRSGGRDISQDLANSIRELNAIDRYTPIGTRTRIAELGAGYGRLAFAALSYARVRYFVFDIPPALYVSQWYLARLFPDRKIFPFQRFADFRAVEAELEQAEIAFLTPNQIALFPDGYFDVFASISTLPEMRPSQIDNYLSLIARLAGSAVYLKQWRTWRNVRDDFAFTYDSLVLPSPWALRLDAPDDVQPMFQQRVWTR